MFEEFEVGSFVSEYVSTKLLDVASIGFKNALKRINRDKEIISLEKFDKNDCIEFIGQHISENLRWATNISFRDSIKTKKLTDVFVDLDLYLSPLKIRAEIEEKVPKIQISNLLGDTETNIVLLGQPGAGKTTSVKKIFLELLLRDSEIYKTFSFPLVIRLKDLSFDEQDKGLILFKEILNNLGIFYRVKGSLDENARKKILVHIFKDFIERLDVLIILDGYDEISDPKLKEEIIKNLRLISNSLLSTKYILTSRTADYDLHIENSKEYELCSLEESQIKEFVYKWISNPSSSVTLFDQLKSSPYWDTTIRPLTLAHLCALFERNNSIPEKPKSVYKKIILLLLEDWSNQRSIKRVSKYSKFEVDRKMDFLSRFAYELTIEFNKISFDSNILKTIYSSICTDFGLPKTEAKQVVQEIESHSGLVLQTSNDSYEFAHKSLLEFLVADYIVKLPIFIKDKKVLLKMPNELAILLAISSNPTATYNELIFNVLKKESIQWGFLLTFLSRMIIEKPDFEPNVLYSLIHIYLLNEIAIKVHEIDQSLPDLQEIIEEEEEKEDFDEEDYFELNRADELYYAEEEADDIKENEIYTAVELEQYRNYLLDCSEIIVSFKKQDVFKNSLRELRNCYGIGPTKLKTTSSKVFLENWGKTYHLKKLRSSIKINSMNFELPDNLILVEEFVN